MDTIAEKLAESQLNEAVLAAKVRCGTSYSGKMIDIDVVDKLRMAAEGGEAIAALLMGDDVFEEMNPHLLHALIYDLLQRFKTIKTDLDAI